MLFFIFLARNNNLSIPSFRDDYLIYKFLKNFCLFILPLVLVGGSIESLVRNIPNDYSYKSQYLDQNADEIEALFLGSSHAYRDINPAFIDVNSFNAAYVSQSLYYDYQILQKYEDNWLRLRYIIISVSYFSLYYELEDSPEAWRVKNYSIYYSMMTSSHVSDYSELFSNRLDINLQRIHSYYSVGQSPITTSDLGWGGLAMSSMEFDLAEKGKIAAQRHTAVDAVLFDENVAILKSIISFADSRNVKVIFYTPPAYKTYVENLNDMQLSHTVKTMMELDDAYPNVVYVNFLTSDLFDEKDFYDADHLNESGAVKFTLEIEKLINFQE